MRLIKQCFKNLLCKSGYKIAKINNDIIQNDNPFKAVYSKFNEAFFVAFDVGANSGNTAVKIKKEIPNATIHCFEPSKIVFKHLIDTTKNLKNIKCNQLAVGDENTVLKFNEYSWSVLNSFLKRKYTTSDIVEQYDVELVTLDSYVTKTKVDYINLLKTDTEGFELNVLKGTINSFKKNKVQFVLVEAFFDENYIGQASFGQIYDFLIANGFDLVRFYDFTYTKNNLVSRSDVLFYNPNFLIK
jgi:FkbM family methyltransferase